MKFKITPKSLILSFLQVSQNQAMPVKSLVSIGSLFGITDNAIRVTTARLIRNGIVESDERGQYQISDKSTVISRFVNSWLHGESRLVPWDQTWICCLLPQASPQNHGKSQKALSLPGFMEGLPNIWVRPNNLKLTLDEIWQILEKLGIDIKAELFIGKEFDGKLTELWQQYLWPVKTIAKNQTQLLAKLNKSILQLENKPFEDALVESYILGSEAIHLLITDPLLPEEIMKNSQRQQLTQAMINYDVIGKKIWKEFSGVHINYAPSHLRLVADGI